MTKPSLNDLSAFASIAEQRSFRKAADTLGVSRSALSHSLKGLEHNLGVRLLNRTTRSVSVTDAGTRLLTRLGPVLEQLDAALDELAPIRGGPGGSLRINANKAAARLLLQSVVPEFLARYPDVELDLVCEGRLVDVVEQGFDAGVRLGEAVPRDMIAIRIDSDTRFLAVASPAYLQSRDRPVIPDDLRGHRCIRQRLPSGKRYRWEFSKRGKEITLDVPGALTLDDNELMVEAAANGQGVAYVPEPFARRLLDSGRLVTVLEDWCPWIEGLTLYYPGRRHVPSALRAFIEVLKESKMAAKKTGSSSKAKSPKSESASKLIDGRIKELGDWRGDMLSRLRALIKEADPEVVEEWKWRGVPVWSHDGIICTGETYKNVVKMTFAKGAALKDPSALFNSSLDGNVRRAIDVREGEKINEAALKTLIRAAVSLNKSKLKR
jgi:DNA-binding transcriptional LysR family regulator